MRPFFVQLTHLHSQRPHTSTYPHSTLLWSILKCTQCGYFCRKQISRDNPRFVFLLFTYSNRSVIAACTNTFYCRGCRAAFWHKSSVRISCTKRDKRGITASNKLSRRTFSYYLFVYRECDIPENPNCSTHNYLLLPGLVDHDDRSIRTKCSNWIAKEAPSETSERIWNEN